MYGNLSALLADLARLVSERAVFQAVASMAIPAFLIHSQVKQRCRVLNLFVPFPSHRRFNCVFWSVDARPSE